MMGIPATIREDFPILRQQMNGKPLVYLDSAATSQKPRQVIDAIVKYYSEYNANIHRGVYAIAERATNEYEAARAKVARFIGAAEPAEVVFTRNVTEALNLVAHGWGRRHVGPGDEILTTELEHHSDLVPWQMLVHERGARLRHIPFDDRGRLVLDDLDRLLTDRTKIVALAHISNVFGTVVPVEAIAKAAHARGAVV
ncbi:MAG: aminotransferase class V-fold PLP-dependent enzyme, partial [bacterium]